MAGKGVRLQRTVDLLEDFDADFYLWEITLMLRRFILVAIMVFGDLSNYSDGFEEDSGRFQCMLAAVVIMFLIHPGSFWPVM